MIPETTDSEKCEVKSKTGNKGIVDIVKKINKLDELPEKKFKRIATITMGLCRADLYMPTHVFNTADVIGKGHNEIIFHIEDGKSLNVKAQVAHAGLAPKERKSGSSINGKTRICKTGNASLRSALYMPAMSATKHNPALREFYQRLISKGKLKMVALVAVMRKLLVYAIGILRNNTPYNPDWTKILQEKFALAS